MRLIRPVGSRQQMIARTVEVLAKRVSGIAKTGVFFNPKAISSLHADESSEKGVRLIPSINPFIAVTSYIQTFFSLKSLPTETSFHHPASSGAIPLHSSSVHSGKPIHYSNQGHMQPLKRSTLSLMNSKSMSILPHSQQQLTITVYTYRYRCSCHVSDSHKGSSIRRIRFQSKPSGQRRNISFRGCIHPSGIPVCTKGFTFDSGNKFWYFPL